MRSILLFVVDTDDPAVVVPLIDTMEAVSDDVQHVETRFEAHGLVSLVPIREAFEALPDVTASDVVRRTGLNDDTVRKYLRGDRRAATGASEEIALKLASAVGVDPVELGL